MSTDWKAAYEDVLANDEIKRLREYIMALEADLHVYHASESLQRSRSTPDMDECPRCIARRPPPADHAAGSDG